MWRCNQSPREVLYFPSQELGLQEAVTCPYLFVAKPSPAPNLGSHSALQEAEVLLNESMES